MVFSVPQSDAHLILAQTAAGLSCFFLPRLLPDGTRNAIRLERLKDKLGNRANASAEVEFQDAFGWLMGEEGDGVRLILKMGGMTRFDCARQPWPDATRAGDCATSRRSAP